LIIFKKIHQKCLQETELDSGQSELLENRSLTSLKVIFVIDGTSPFLEMGGAGEGQCQQKYKILYRVSSNIQKSALELYLGL